MLGKVVLLMRRVRLIVSTSGAFALTQDPESKKRSTNRKFTRMDK